MTEREKMLKGLWYDANFEPELLSQRKAAEVLCHRFLLADPCDTHEQRAILRELLPHMGANVSILAPFYTDYGYNCQIGDGTFINHNAYLMDGASITIGENCFIGPNCGMYTATHPLLPEQRNQGLEKASPIAIGDNVWLGASVIILPGVTIGSCCVIGAGSVVTKNIPDGVIAVGNPCRVVRKLDENDRLLEI